MNVARLAVLGVALGAGVVAMLLAGGSDEPEPVEVAVAPSNTIDVLVAAKDINMGFGLTNRDLKWQAWPADATVRGFVTRDRSPDALQEMAGRITRAGFIEGEPINEAKLVDAERGFLSAILEKGMRAVSTEISPETGAGGFILPNDHVDVILTRRDEGAEASGGGDVYLSETILANIRVLAIDQTVQEQDGNQVVVGSTATLALSPDQAEVLTLSRQLGDLSLILRSLEDSTPDAAGDEIEGPKGRVTVMQYGVKRQVIAR